MSRQVTTDEITLEPDATQAQVTFEQISIRAYEIHMAGDAGGDTENWLRAEKELLDQADTAQQSDTTPGNSNEN